MTNNWKSIESRTDEELKQVAKDLYNNLIFTDRHCDPNNLMLTFMVLMFMGPKEPKKPSDDSTIDGHRDNVIYDLFEYENELKKYQEDLKSYKEEYLPSIGMIYEYFSQAGPTSVNGNPCFFSCRFLNKQDTEKMIEHYQTYKTLRENIDNF